MTVCTVYGDLLFFTDFLMDLALLFAVMRFGNFKTRFFFPVAAASLGGAYSLLTVLPAFVFWRSWYVKLLFSLVMVKIAFPHLTGKRFFTAFIYFYLIGFAMAGAVLALSWLCTNGGWAQAGFSYTAMGLSGAVIIALALSYWGKFYVKRTLRENETTEQVVIQLNGKKASLTALFDTGNELTDPVTRLPVVVVEYDAVKEILPSYFHTVFSHCGADHPDRALLQLQTYPIAHRLRLIPFSSIGKSNGMMLGIRPDKLCFPARKKKEAEDVVICFYRGTMHIRENCRCIVNPAILDMI